MGVGILVLVRIEIITFYFQHGLVSTAHKTSKVGSRDLRVFRGDVQQVSKSVIGLTKAIKVVYFFSFRYWLFEPQSFETERSNESTNF